LAFLQSMQTGKERARFPTDLARLRSASWLENEGTHNRSQNNASMRALSFVSHAVDPLTVLIA